MKEDIRQYAQSLGFDVVRFTKPAGFLPQLKAWLAAGYNGNMAWMAENPEVRADPRVLMPQVETVIAVGMNYGPDHNPMHNLQHADRGNISVYARGDDYHDVVKKRLKQLGNWLAQTYKTELKVFVDTAPVMEKPLAQLAGIGWQGKHSNVVSREFGSWLFLGILYTALPVEPDVAEIDHCGSCRKCLDACPTQAFPQPYVVDARRCISYLTIENKEPIPLAFRKAIGNRIYGCDDCLSVCPWNKFAAESRHLQFHARAELAGAKLADLVQLDDTAFRALFRKSPIKRIGRNRFVRNVLIAIGNSNDKALLPYAQQLQNDPDPVVAEAATWAVAELQA